jgi:hypothetical protein
MAFEMLPEFCGERRTLRITFMKRTPLDRLTGPVSLLLRLSLTQPIEEIVSKHKQVIQATQERKDLTPLVKFWVQLSSLESVELDELDGLRVAQTGTRVLDLFRSMTSVAIILKEDSSVSPLRASISADRRSPRQPPRPIR